MVYAWYNDTEKHVNVLENGFSPGSGYLSWNPDGYSVQI